METNEYLRAVLASQQLEGDSAELKDLQSERAKVEEIIRKKFGSVPTIRYGGSKAKGDLIKEWYDLDLICYFPFDSNAGGETLEDIYRNVRDCLSRNYYVEEKTSAVRLRNKDAKEFMRDFHIDVIPGRFTDDTKGDCFIYQKSLEKCRLKTNLDVHISHIKNSGVLDPLRLMKLWKVRRVIRLKNFVFELIVIDLLHGKKSSSLEDQLTHVWTKLRDSSEPIVVEDPANPAGNDFAACVKDAWPELSGAAAATLTIIGTFGWESVLGTVGKTNATGNVEKMQRAAAAVITPNKPWCP
jgi:tRNA nucleotidyltransferase (CCA-adding enzyme)